MAELKIEMLGSPALRKKADEIVEVDAELQQLIADMFETMYVAEGIGLAGPQVGVSRRVVVIDVKEEEQTRMALINPRIVEVSGEIEKEEEGCLSIPGVSALVARRPKVIVEAIDEHGDAVRLEADGLLGRCLQHEIDHLNGVLFIDHLSALKRSMLVKKYRQILAEEAEEKADRTTSRRGR